MDSRIISILQQSIEARLFPGCVVGYIKNGKTQIIATGNYTFDEDSPRVKNDSLYDVASLTKVIPTSSLALQLIDRNQIRIHDKVSAFLPQACSPMWSEVEVWHLLTQTLSFGFRLSDLSHLEPDEIKEKIYSTPFTDPPGERFHYCNATSIVLGELIENIYGTPLDEVSSKELFTPLHMTRTTFRPLQIEQTQNIVPSEMEGITPIQGIVHDESTRVLSQKYIVGSAGLFSTAPDILKFLQVFVDHGEVSGRRYFSKQILSLLSRNQLQQDVASTGLGWELNQRHYMGTSSSEKTIGKTGFTGCVCMYDPMKNTALVALSNCTYPIRNNDPKMINTFRRNLADIVFGP